jgi:hypothetical protein
MILNDIVMDQCGLVAWIALKAFLLGICCLCVWNIRKLFVQIHGIRHRVAGAIHLCLLLIGAFTARGYDTNLYQSSTHHHHRHRQQQNQHSTSLYFWMFDTLLGSSGIVLTLTAAHDFPHKYVVNQSEGDCVQSGTLHQEAIVTQDEMIEHAFYQALNLWQAMYLHTQHYVGDRGTIWTRLGLLWLVTAPWLVRQRVPVHSFSHNWKLYRRQSWSEEEKTTEVIMYKMKKAQYIFYKHCILHGVNISVVLNRQALSQIPNSFAWRTFWMLLNTSYVMEFFLQSLVKRKMLHQATMLLLNQSLMIAASLGATIVLKYVPLWLVGVSMALNFGHRHHEVINTMGIAVVALVFMKHVQR